MQTVLFVDDTIQTLESYKAMFAGQQGKWLPYFADNAGEAMDIIEERTIDIIITDLEMPIIDGVKLLKLVKEKSPITIRVLLSGCTNEIQVLESANLAHQIFAKPSCFKEINYLLERSLYLHSIKLSSNARKVLTKLGSIPAVPAILNQVMESISKENFSLREIGHLISTDLSMSIGILRLVNTPYFGLDHKITSVEQAVSLLGLDVIKPLIISIHFFETFGTIDQKQMEDLLNHSATTGRFCRAIFQYEKMGQKECDRAFITGFMHDIGRVIMMDLYPKQYILAIETALETKCGTDIAEKRLMQATHAEIGAFMLGLWGLDDELIEAVHFHHSPSTAKCENPLLLASLHCADLFDVEINGTHHFCGCDNLDVRFLEKHGLLDKEEHWLAACHKENDR